MSLSGAKGCTGRARGDRTVRSDGRRRVGPIPRRVPSEARTTRHRLPRGRPANRSGGRLSAAAVVRARTLSLDAHASRRRPSSPSSRSRRACVERRVLGVPIQPDAIETAPISAGALLARHARRQATSPEAAGRLSRVGAADRTAPPSHRGAILGRHRWRCGQATGAATEQGALIVGAPAGDGYRRETRAADLLRPSSFGECASPACASGACASGMNIDRRSKLMASSVGTRSDRGPSLTARRCPASISLRIYRLLTPK